MMFVAIASVVYWRRRTSLPYRWFWLGAGLWAVAVAIKVAIAILTNPTVFAYLGGILSYPTFVAIGGLYGGLQSSLCEIGLTWLAVLIWRNLGRDADRAIGIGLGAGAFEAFALGLAAALAVSTTLAGVEKTEAVRQQIDGVAAVNPLFWLIGTAERIIAILCHASSRALVILGAVHHLPWMIFWGFFIFTAIDGIATAVHISGRLGTFSMWWIELALLPAAIVSIPILHWCYRHWGSAPADSLTIDPKTEVV